MADIEITATEQEIAVLLQLLHRAVLHGGMEVAAAAVSWQHKLMQATQAARGPATENGHKPSRPSKSAAITS